MLQELTFVGEGSILSIIDGPLIDDANYNSYCIIPIEKFNMVDSKPLNLTIANGYYCSLSGNKHIYISRHRPCKNPTALCAINNKETTDINPLFKRDLPNHTESRIRFLEDTCATVLNVAESVLSVAYAIEGKSPSDVMKDENVLKIIHQRDILNKRIEERKYKN